MECSARALPQALAVDEPQAATGFFSAADIPACTRPQLAFAELCGGDAAAISSITLGSWLKLAPGMGLTDTITADTAFDQLSARDPAAEGEARCISLQTFVQYTERL